MAELAQLGFRLPTGEIDNAKAALESLSPAAASAEKSAKKVENAMSKTEAAAAGLSGDMTKLEMIFQDMSLSIVRLSDTVASLEIKLGSLGTKSRKAAEGANDLGNSLIGVKKGTKDLNEHVLAYQNSLNKFSLGNEQFDAHILAYRNHMGGVEDSNKKVRNSFGLTAAEGLNFGRQMADVGVTAAMGMSPFMIAVQQGPQILDILQMSAQRTGTTVKAVFAQMARAAGAALLPFLPIIALVTAAVGAMYGTMTLAARAANKENAGLLEGMNLTEKQMERVKKSGVDTAITIGDVWGGFLDTIGSRITKALAEPIDYVRKKWNSWLDYITKHTYETVRSIVGAFAGAAAAIEASWGNLGPSIRYFLIKEFNAMLDDVQSFTNSILSAMDSVADFLGFNKEGRMSKVDLSGYKMDFDKDAADAGAKASKAFASGMKDGMKWVDGVIDETFENAAKRTRAQIEEAAGDPEKSKKERKKKEKKEKEGDPRDWALIAQMKNLEYMEKLKADVKNNPLRLPIETAEFDDALRRSTGLVQEYFDKFYENQNQAREMFKGFFNDMKSNLQQGQTVWSAFANSVISALGRIADKMMDKALDSLFNSLFGNSDFGGLFGSLFGAPSAKGNVFDGPKRFAKGAGFMNQVVNSTTPFLFGKGGSQLGIMGEAGPEAVMPLSRGPDGSLGVQMYGGGSGGGSSSASPARVLLEVSAVEGELFVPRVKAIAEDKAVEVTQAGISQFNDALPGRFSEIASDERAR